MTTSDPGNQHLADDEILVYVGEDDLEPEDQDAFQPEFGHKRKSAKELGLEKVTLTDEELNRLRKQVQRIAGKLGPDTDQDQSFAVDSVTLHVGVSASGHFFFIANAGVEAAIDVTWRRRSAN